MYSVAHPPRTMLEVFEGLPEGTLCQLINNNIVMSPSPKPHHQRLSKKIFKQLDSFIEENGLGEVLYAPLDVHLDEKNVFQPDIIFISTDRSTIIQDKIKGAPDLVIEILSPGTEKYDRKEKKAIYEQYGVIEYWIVDPLSKSVTGYQLMENKYQELTASKGLIESPLLHLTITF
jgi:Uma2 family endonuclease